MSCKNDIDEKCLLIINFTHTCDSGTERKVEMNQFRRSFSLQTLRRNFEEKKTRDFVPTKEEVSTLYLLFYYEFSPLSFLALWDRTSTPGSYQNFCKRRSKVSAEVFD